MAITLSKYLGPCVHGPMSPWPHVSFHPSIVSLRCWSGGCLVGWLPSIIRGCYYQLRQLRTVARSLTASAATTLVHAFITSRLDYSNCSTLYTGLPAFRLSCLERVMRSAARLIGKIQKFDHVTRYTLDVLHWLPVRQRIQYRVVSLVWRCQLGLAPAYLRDLCRPVSGAQASRSLRSAE